MDPTHSELRVVGQAEIEARALFVVEVVADATGFSSDSIVTFCEERIVTPVGRDTSGNFLFDDSCVYRLRILQRLGRQEEIRTEEVRKLVVRLQSRIDSLESELRSLRERLP